MFFITSFLILFFISLLQITIIPRLTLFGAMPNLILVSLIIWAVFFGFKKSVWLTIIIGLLLDLFSGVYFGTFTFFFLLMILIVDLNTNYIFSNNFLFSIIVSCLIFSIIFTFLFNWLTFKSLLLNYKSIFVLLFTSIFNLLTAVLFFPLFNKFREKIEFYEKKVKLPL